MKIRFLIYLIPFLFSYSCLAQKNGFSSTGDYKTAINNAIIDFMKMSSLQKKDNVFNISFKELNSGIIAVGIIGSHNKFYIDGNKPLTRMPTNYIEVNNKLFYWYDANEKDNNIIDKLKEYNLIEYDSEIFEYVVDDKKEGVNYYFCKNNLKNYKKQKTNLPLKNETKFSCK